MVIRGCHTFSEKGEGRRANGRMENEECELPFCCPHVVRIYALFKRLDLKFVLSSIMHFL